jgi:hypothetical protein
MTDEQRALEFADKLCSSAMNVVAASADPTDNKWNRDSARKDWPVLAMLEFGGA